MKRNEVMVEKIVETFGANRTYLMAAERDMTVCRIMKSLQTHDSHRQPPPVDEPMIRKGSLKDS